MIGAILICLVNGVAIAQDKPADQMEILREKARANKKLVVATALALTEGEAKVFWPVYNVDQSDMITYDNRVSKLLGTSRRRTGRGPTSRARRSAG